MVGITYSATQQASLPFILWTYCAIILFEPRCAQQQIQTQALSDLRATLLFCKIRSDCLISSSNYTVRICLRVLFHATVFIVCFHAAMFLYAIILMVFYAFKCF